MMITVGAGLIRSICYLSMLPKLVFYFLVLYHAFKIPSRVVTTSAVITMHNDQTLPFHYGLLKVFFC